MAQEAALKQLRSIEAELRLHHSAGTLPSHLRGWQRAMADALRAYKSSRITTAEASWAVHESAWRLRQDPERVEQRQTERLAALAVVEARIQDEFPQFRIEQGPCGLYVPMLYEISSEQRASLLAEVRMANRAYVAHRRLERLHALLDAEAVV